MAYPTFTMKWKVFYVWVRKPRNRVWYLETQARNCRLSLWANSVMSILESHPTTPCGESWRQGSWSQKVVESAAPPPQHIIQHCWGVAWRERPAGTLEVGMSYGNVTSPQKSSTHTLSVLGSSSFTLRGTSNFWLWGPLWHLGVGKTHNKVRERHIESVLTWDV